MQLLRVWGLLLDDGAGGTFFCEAEAPGRTLSLLGVCWGRGCREALGCCVALGAAAGSPGDWGGFQDIPLGNVFLVS